MGEQALDLRATGAALRRGLGAIALVGVVGAVLGAGVPLLRPPMYTSSSEVLLPTPVVVEGQQPDTTTQVEIASSETVLGPAGAAAAPGVSFNDLSKRIKVSAPSDQTLDFRAEAPTAAEAEALADAAAKSELAYVARTASTQKNSTVIDLLGRVDSNLDALRQQVNDSPAHGSPQLLALAAELATLSGQVGTMTAAAAPTPGTAAVIQPASPATRPGILTAYVVPVAVGLVAAVLLAALITVLLARRGRSLRTRDQMAVAVGSPIIASFRGRPARSMAGWYHLLSHYEPSPVDAWALRQVLRQLPSDADGRRHLTVVSAGSDRKAAGFGPLLATSAAASGIRTELVVHGLAPSLAVAGALHRLEGHQPREGLTVTGGPDAVTDADLVVVVTSAQALAEGELHGDALIAASPGAMTAKRLAATAMATDDAGGEVIGVVVVDPDPTDRTSGRLLGRGGEHRRDLPLHVPGVVSLSPREEQVR